MGHIILSMILWRLTNRKDGSQHAFQQCRAPGCRQLHTGARTNALHKTKSPSTTTPSAALYRKIISFCPDASTCRSSDMTCIVLKMTFGDLHKPQHIDMTTPTKHSIANVCTRMCGTAANHETFAADAWPQYALNTSAPYLTWGCTTPEILR